MKKWCIFYCILIGCMMLLGWQQESGQKSNDDIGDFYFINKAPAATEKHSLDELIKIYFSSKGVAVDLENNEIYENPRYSTNGVTTFEDPIFII